MTHTSQRPMRFARLAISIALLAWLPLVGGELAAKDRDRPREKRAPEKAAEPAPFTLGEEFFPRFLGESNEEDQQALEAVEILPKEEKRLGDAAAEAYLNELRKRGVRVVQRGADVDYLRKLIAALRPMLRNAERYRNVQIHLAETPEVDARSFPGGTVVVFRGLIDFAESEAALVGVLGHELSHFDRGHQLISLKRMKLAKQTFSGKRPFEPKDMLAAGGQMTRLFGRPFRPEDEAQADEDGAAWAFRAGYDPREMAKLLLRLGERKPAGDKPRFMPAFLRTHPFSIDRHRAIMAQAEALIRETPQASLYVGRENLAQRIPRTEQEFDR